MQFSVKQKIDAYMYNWGEPHLGPYSGCGLCHIKIMNISYVLPNAHVRNLCGEHFKVQRSVEAASAGQRREARGNARGIVAL